MRMISIIKVKHKDGITIIETDIKTRIKCSSGEIKYVEETIGNHSSLITDHGYKQTYVFKGIK